MGDKIERNEMGGACGACGGEESFVQGFGKKNLRERDHWGNPDVNGRKILRRIFRNSGGILCLYGFCFWLGCLYLYVYVYIFCLLLAS
jgi:hypothetical protein